MISKEQQTPVTEWNDRTRRTVWFIMTKTKKFLNIQISPIIATAFIILQSYFRDTPDNQYRLFTLVCASLTFSCKLSETYKSIQDVFSAVLRVCIGIPSKVLKDFVFGTTFTQDLQPSNDESELIKNAEISLMSSLGFDFDIELPFVYVDKWEHNFTTVIPKEYKVSFIQQVQLDCCLVICSESCLDVPAEVCAAAAFTEAMKSQPRADSSHLEDYIKQKYGDTSYELAINSIRIELSRTAPMPTQQNRTVQKRV